MTIPLICVFLAFLLIYVPRGVVARAQGKLPEGFDNNNPRDQQSRLTGWGRRAQAAHLNAIEGFGPFAAAVFTAHLAGADARWSSILAVVYVASRALYIPLYLADKAPLRSVVWLLGMAAIIGLFILKWIV